MQHSVPLSSEEALETQETRQSLTHNYLKELGESSCPQIIVKTVDSQRAAYVVRTHTHTYIHTYTPIVVYYNSRCSLFSYCVCILSCSCVFPISEFK